MSVECRKNFDSLGWVASSATIFIHLLTPEPKRARAYAASAFFYLLISLYIRLFWYIDIYTCIHNSASRFLVRVLGSSNGSSGLALRFFIRSSVLLLSFFVSAKLSELRKVGAGGGGGSMTFYNSAAYLQMCQYYFKAREWQDFFACTRAARHLWCILLRRRAASSSPLMLYSSFLRLFRSLSPSHTRCDCSLYIIEDSGDDVRTRAQRGINDRERETSFLPRSVLTLWAS